MTAEQILQNAQLAFMALQALIQLGKDEEPALSALWQTLVLKKPLTDAQRQSLLTSHQEMTTALQAPLAD
ncbi:hypothetical protein [Rhizobium tubonense]|uniref:Uncharacterized protein n=1 Tax=Rhizobium tubonense TaxID=484088 RepID=A0A2W4E4T9_9HYPH|nr:hypothetical protein [Rhizobium tubonense]PZM07573.1 hypothetical protein CPY51_31065 [Rhizobium tubonense]